MVICLLDISFGRWIFHAVEARGGCEQLDAFVGVNHRANHQTVKGCLFSTDASFCDSHFSVLEKEEIGYALWNPACRCQLLRVGFRLELLNSSHLFVGIAYRTDEASLCCNMIDMSTIGFSITCSARGDIIRDGVKTVFHPTKPVQSLYYCE